MSFGSEKTTSSVSSGGIFWGHPFTHPHGEICAINVQKVLHTSCPEKSMKKPQKNENKKQMK